MSLPVPPDHLPFTGDHEAAVLYSISHDEPEPLARYKSGTEAELQNMVSKALAKDPGLRYQTASSIATDVKRFRMPAAAPVAPTRRHSGMWVAIAAIDFST